MSQLPPFLETLDRQLPGQPSTQPAEYINSLFRHKRVPSVSHALWWPSKGQSKNCLIFVTGNPGLIDFYTPFLTAIHVKAKGNVNILGHALVGHTPGLEDHATQPSSTPAAAQVDAVIEIVDAVRVHYDNLTIAAHSFGAWVALQALKARPGSISSVLLLFPSISHIADTPNGHKLSRLFNPPIPTILSCLSVLLRLLPMRMMSAVYRDWPTAQLQVLRGFLDSRTCVYNSLNLAHDEMRTIKELDVSLVQQYRHRIHLYFGDDDDWVGKQREAILQAFDADEDNVRIFHGHPDIPHAFCINHGEQVAEQCYQWLQSAEFI
ncbi:alpha/beta-hydrolase [Trametopsis cervina]|nr:alpha/beta-hydrolase [Trametopsis cervina]